MSPTRAPELLLLFLGPLLVGFAGGIVYFEVLRQTVTRLTAHVGWLQPVALTMSRIGMAVGIFAIAARIGSVALLATFVGFLIARTTALHRSRRAG